MKLIFAIIHDDDSNRVTEELNRNEFSVTRLATTGGFLRKGNTTLLIGTEEERVESAIDLIKQNCGQRKQIVYNTPYTPAGVPGVASYGVVPITVEAGGAIIFVLDVEQYVKT